MARTGKQHHRLLAIARGELRKGVKEVPDGSNTGPDVLKYQRATWLSGTHWPWCVAFWQWCNREAGIDVPWKGAGAYAALDWAKSVHLAIPLSRAGVGDALVLNIGAGHMAIITADAPFTNTVPTINGNVSDRVIEKDWPVSLVRGCIHIPESHNTPKPTSPIFEVVTSVSGHAKVVFSGRRNAVASQLGKLFNKYGGITVRRRSRAV